MSNNNQGSKKFIPKSTPSVQLPPKVDNELLSQASQVACNLVGFPCEVEIFSGPGMKEPGFRIAADLDYVQSNLIIYSFLKEFNIFYLQTHQKKTGPTKVTCFKNLISAVHDFGLCWNTFRAIDPSKADHVVQLCRIANAKAAEAILAEMQAKKQ